MMGLQRLVDAVQAGGVFSGASLVVAVALIALESRRSRVATPLARVLAGRCSPACGSFRTACSQR